jgi:hypothetical protein
VRWRSSRCPSLGCSTLGAELEWNSEDSNDLRGSSFPSYDLTSPLYIEVGRVHGDLGELCLWSTCAGVQEGLVAAPCGQWRCHGAEEALGVVRLLCSDTLSVRLCRLRLASPRCTFWRLLGGEGGQLEGLTRGPRSPRAPRASEGVCLLTSCPVRDSIRGVVDRAALAGQCWGAPRASELGAHLLMPRTLAGSQGPGSSFRRSGA